MESTRAPTACTDAAERARSPGDAFTAFGYRRTTSGTRTDIPHDRDDEAGAVPDPHGTPP